MRRLAICAVLAGFIGCIPLAPEGEGESGSSSGGSSTSGSGGGSTRSDEGARLSSHCAAADYGASAAAMKVSTFLQATARFATAAGEVEGGLKDTCREMGVALGMSPTDLSGDVRSTCDAVSAKLREEMQAVRAHAEVRIVAVPPRCEVRAEAYASCAAQCEVDYDPGEVPVCEGGYVYGQCSAQCQGECAVEVHGACRGECQGSCSGGCTGTCNGTCEGTCSATDANGQCAGRCDGTCHGSCSAGCQGSCDGECWVSGRASCQGSCRGGCSVEYQEPVCTGTYRAPSVSADCQASCEARLQAEAHCTRGEYSIEVSGGADQAQVTKLRAAFRQLGRLSELKERAVRLRVAGRDLVAAARDLRGVAQAGIDAIACVTEAAAVSANALANVSVSVEVSVSVSASASATAG